MIDSLTTTENNTKQQEIKKSQFKDVKEVKSTHKEKDDY